MISLVALLAAAAAAAPVPPKAGGCADCHGATGNSKDPAIPSIAGQQHAYLSIQLVLFREEQRKDPQMALAVKDLSDAEIEELAGYYAAQRPTGGGRKAPPARLASGRKVAEANHCGSCHMPDLGGQRHVPRLAGLHPEYLLKEMRAFKAQARAELDGSMTMAAQALSPRDIEDVVAYIASLPAVPAGSGPARSAPARGR